MSSEPRLAAEWDPARSRCRGWGWVAFLLALLPALAALAIVPGFVTQDGPAHGYNAEIIARSGDPESPFRAYYRVRWEPLPNWTGHLVMVGLLRLLPARAADRVMSALTLVAFAGSIFWLRWRVNGWRGMPSAALLAVLLALNVTWLLGFTSFVLGACLFPITLGVWWQGREAIGRGRVAALGALVTLGYFSHLVSLGLTVIGLAVLAVATPGARRRARAGATAVSLVPLVPLGALYLRLSRSGGPMHPVWEHLTDPSRLRSWLEQLGWVDPISLARKIAFPFAEPLSYGFVALTPVLWLAIALTVAGAATLAARRAGPMRGWGVLAALLVLGGLVGPDTLGESHGHYLPQRVLLFGLVALVPFLDFDAGRRAGAAALVALVMAVATQSGFLWEYARASDRTAGPWIRARAAVGDGRRVATLLIQSRGRFRANPLLHADNLLGNDTGNIIWSNYETRFYYFPVQFDATIDRPLAAELEWIALHDRPQDAQARAAVWSRLLERHHRAIDILAVWGRDPALDAIDDRWFQPRPIYEEGGLRIFRHR